MMYYCITALELVPICISGRENALGFMVLFVQYYVFKSM